jgi:hypothetical protein
MMIQPGLALGPHVPEEMDPGPALNDNGLGAWFGQKKGVELSAFFFFFFFLGGRA